MLMKLGPSGEAFFVEEMLEPLDRYSNNLETSPIPSPTHSDYYDSDGEEEKGYSPIELELKKNKSADAMSSSSEGKNEQELKLYVEELENKTSEEVLCHLREQLEMPDGEEHEISEALEKGKHPSKGRIRWIYGELPDAKPDALEMEEKKR